MNVGLPTTGVGGIFYLLSILMILPIEIIRTLLGDRSLTRWKFVAIQGALALSISGLIYMTGYVIKALYPVSSQSAQINAAEKFVSSYGVFSINPIIAVVVGLVIIDTVSFLLVKLKSK